MPQHSPIRTRRAIFGALALVLLAGCWLAPARADEFVDQANQAGAATPGTIAAEDTLFPALAEMDAPPMVSPAGAKRNRGHDVMLLREGDPEWGQLVRWAEGANQQAALEALHAIADPEATYIIGIPYDDEGVDPEWREAGLHCSLNESELLIGLSFDYLDRLWWLSTLALVEAERLAAAGEAEKSLRVLVDLTRLGRIMTERAFTVEKAVGFSFMFDAAQRMRDVVYSHTDAFDPKLLSETAEKIHPDTLEIMRIRLPDGDRIRVEQLLAFAFEHRGSVDSDTLARVMANAESSDRPLRLFSLQAWWRSLASQHKDWFDTGDRIGEVWKDYEKRWDLPFTNRLHETATHFERIDPADYPVIYHTMSDISMLFGLRFDLIVELDATYSGLGVYAFKLRQRKFPPTLAAIHPGYIEKKVGDITNLDRSYRVPRPRGFSYKVPIRDDTFDRREDPHPYEFTVVLEPGALESAPVFPTVEVPEDASWNDDVVLGWFEGIAGVGWAPDGTFEAGLLTDGGKEIDAERFKAAALAALPKATFTSDDMFNFRFGIGILEALRQGDAKQGFRRILELLPVYAQLEEMGVGLDSYIDLNVDMARAIWESDGFEAIRKKAESGDFSEDDMRDWERLNIETQITGSFMDRSAQVMEEWGPRAVTMKVRFREAMDDRPVERKVFAASLDDSVFMLWAAGENEKNDVAKVVGPIGSGADDILFWPPIVALEREFNR